MRVFIHIMWPPQIFVCLFIMHMQLNRESDEPRIRTHRYLKMTSSSTSNNPMSTKNDADDDRTARIAAHVEEPAIVIQRIIADDDDEFGLPLHFMRRMDEAREALDGREMIDDVETQIEPSVVFEKIMKKMIGELNERMDAAVRAEHKEDDRSNSTTSAKSPTTEDLKKDKYLMPCHPSITVNYPCNPYGDDCDMNGRIVISCERVRSPLTG